MTGTVLFCLAACGSAPPPDRTTLLTTEPETDTAGADTEESAGPSTVPAEAPEDLRERIIADGRHAAEILTRTACEQDTTDSAAEAAIYALRVGLPADRVCIGRALARGIDAEDIVLRAASWACLVRHPRIALPPLPDEHPEDPAVALLAALAHLIRNEPLPAALSDALCVPGTPPPAAAESPLAAARLAKLSASADPFDSGLVAAAVATAEARFAETVEQTPEGPVRTAEKLRKEVLAALGLGEGSLPPRSDDAPCPSRPTVLGDRLENPLSENPRDVLQRIALSAETPLRIEALRALTISAESPSMNDLAAAAAALQSEDAAVRREGARTYLLLVRRLSR